jgi:hypothetical protein
MTAANRVTGRSKLANNKRPFLGKEEFSPTCTSASQPHLNLAEPSKKISALAKQTA